MPYYYLLSRIIVILVLRTTSDYVDLVFSMSLKCSHVVLDQNIWNISTASHSKVDFDFLVRGQFLRTSLSSHMETEGISTVRPADAEYFLVSVSELSGNV